MGRFPPPTGLRFIASIDECQPDKADNTDTAYRFEVITRIRYTADGRDPDPQQFSWLYVTDRSDLFSIGSILTGKVLAYSRNALLTGRTGVALGSFATGSAAANYNGKGRAQLDAWDLVSDLEEWRLVAQDSFPDHTSYDWTDWVAGWTCALGGSAFAVGEHGENRINGVRMSPPTTDSRIFSRARRAALNADGANPPRTATIRDHNDTYARPRGGSSPRRPRVP